MYQEKEFNKTGWENKEYDRLVELANKTGDQTKRYENLKRNQKKRKDGSGRGPSSQDEQRR